MTKKNQHTKSRDLSRRLHYPEDEKKTAWLPLLLDVHAIIDTGVAVAIRDEEKKRKSGLACGKGCGNCCSHQKDLPFYPHELVGIYWYVLEKMNQPLREILAGRLAAHSFGAGCPFLVDNACSIHPFRPAGCRQFNVFTTPCAPGEDPYHTRRNDVVVPKIEYTDRAFAAAVPFYPELKQREPGLAVKSIRSQIMNLQSFDWSKLVSLLKQQGQNKT